MKRTEYNVIFKKLKKHQKKEIFLNLKERGIAFQEQCNADNFKLDDFWIAIHDTASMNFTTHPGIKILAEKAVMITLYDHNKMFHKYYSEIYNYQLRHLHEVLEQI